VTIAHITQTFEVDAKGLQPDDNGFLTVPARVTKAGVFPYVRGSKVVQVLRPADEVFKADSLATLAMKPVTDEHPDQNYVDAATARKHQVGSSGDSVAVVTSDGAPVDGTPSDPNAAARVQLVITDAEVVRKVLSGKRTFSAGYSCKIVDEAGEWNGKPYQQKQVDIRYNHIALVANPRLGRDMAIADAASICYDSNHQEPQSMKFKKQTIGGKEFAEVTIADAAEAQAELDARVAAVDAAAAGARKEADALTGEVAGLKAQIETLKTEKQADSLTPEKIGSAVGSRLEKLAVAGHFGVPVKHTDSDDTIMRAVLTARQIKTDGFSADALSGAFSTLSQQVVDHNSALASLAKLGAASSDPKGTKEGDSKPAPSPRQKYLDSLHSGSKAAGAK
jgi:hypothetical protein